MYEKQKAISQRQQKNDFKILSEEKIELINR